MGVKIVYIGYSYDDIIRFKQGELSRSRSRAPIRPAPGECIIIVLLLQSSVSRVYLFEAARYVYE